MRVSVNHFLQKTRTIFPNNTVNISSGIEIIIANVGQVVCAGWLKCYGISIYKLKPYFGQKTPNMTTINTSNSFVIIKC